jgi:F-type H+-transporting ATPase subunit c
MGADMMVLASAAMALAAEAGAAAWQVFGDPGLAGLGAGLGAGLVVIGAARGIGGLAGNAVESMARQPEAGARIFVSLIIAGALIEGFTFFALIVCLTIPIGG